MEERFNMSALIDASAILDGIRDHARNFELPGK
jgi:hypothetical protein